MKTYLTTRILPILVIVLWIALLAGLTTCVVGREDIDTIVATVVMEASNAPEDIQGVVNVIKNRADKAGQSMTWVVSQRGQFHGYSRRHLAKTSKFIARWEASEEAVRAALADELPDITGGALFFNQTPGAGRIKLGAHYFRRNA